MSYAILGTLMLLLLSLRIWRYGGFVTAVIALGLGAVITAAGGPIATLVRWVVTALRDVIGWLAGALF